jgi:cytochrome P450
MNHSNPIQSNQIPITEITTLVLAFFLVRILKSKKDPNNSNNSIITPPVVKLGMIETTKSVSGANLAPFLLKCARGIKSSTYRLNTPRLKMLIVSGDIDVCKKMLQDSTCVKSNGLKTFKLIHNGGDDILTSSGAFWKHSRKGIAAAFSSNHIKRMNEVVIQKTEEFVRQKLDTIAGSGKAFDVGEEMIDLTLSIVCDAAFEYQMTPQDKELFLTELGITMQEARMGMIPLRWKIGQFFIPAVNQAREGGERLVSLGYKILESYRNLHSPTKGTVIDRIVNNKQYKDDRERASDILILLVAGHDTTAYTLAWTLIELAKNQSEQIKLRNDLNSLSAPKEHIHSIALNHVIKESMRLRPVAAIGSGRIANHDVIVKRTGEHKNERDMLIPKGSTVLCSMMLLHRNPNYYDDPDVFKPSRWLNPLEKAVAAFQPFSMGKRNCVGQSLAKLEIKNVLARLCAGYHFTIADEGVEVTDLTYHPKKALLSVSKL